jgi:hypothetical protein
MPAGASEAASLVEEYYVDVKDASGLPRLAVVNLALDPADRKVLPEMNGTDVRRAVHAILSSKTAEVLRTPKEREDLRKEVTAAINQVLKREAVKTFLVLGSQRVVSGSRPAAEDRSRTADGAIHENNSIPPIGRRMIVHDMKSPLMTYRG